MAARLMAGASTSCTQPSMMATRLAWGALGLKADFGFRIFSFRAPGGTSASAAAIRRKPILAITSRNGLANQPSVSMRRKRLGFGSTRLRNQRVMRCLVER